MKKFIKGAYNTQDDLNDAFAEIETVINGMVDDMYDKNINHPSIGFGINHVIKHLGKTTTAPKFTFKGKSLINLLGNDGSCEDISKWVYSNATISLDTDNNIYGMCAFKVLTNSVVGNHYIRTANQPTISPEKYYIALAEIKVIGNITPAIILFSSADDIFGLNSATSHTVSDTTKFSLVYVKLSTVGIPTAKTLIPQLSLSTATTSDGCYIDGYRVYEIDVDTYNKIDVDPEYTGDNLSNKFPYVNGYTCLQNPYVEIRHHNLVKNGNLEDGLKGWTKLASPTSVKVENGYFVVTDDDNVSLEGLIQYVDLLPNTTYYLQCVGKCADAGGTCIRIDFYDELKNRTSTVNYEISNLTDSIIGGSFTTPINLKCAKIDLGGGSFNASVGTGYFKEIMLVEGNVAPTEYKSCEIERFVLEGKFTDDDEVTYENGKVTGQVNWKHRILYGKDFDCQFSADYAGFKRIKIPNFPFDGNSNYAHTISIKPDGKILTNDDVYLSNVDLFTRNTIDGHSYISISDTDTGWLDAFIPNNDEVKAFMNGWKAIICSTRIQGWVSVIDGSVPPVSSKTTVATAYTANATSLIVADGTKFIISDTLMVKCDNGTWRNTTISAIAGNTLTVAAISQSSAIGSDVVRIDNGTTDTRILNYCKNNIPNDYDGYQLHYKLAKPESLNNNNCLVKGNIPLIKTGDNYINIDNGMVIGESSFIPFFDGGFYWINNIYADTYILCKLRERTESIQSVYKNNVYDDTWTIQTHNFAHGKQDAKIAQIDLNATYSVDYKILATKAPQISASMVCEYDKDIVGIIGNIQEEISSKQKSNIALDNVIDLSIYEEIILPAAPYLMWWSNSTGTSIRAFIPFSVMKACIPTITIDSATISTGSSSSTLINAMNKVTFSTIYVTRIGVFITYSLTDATTISNIKTYGLVGSFNITADCRGRI